MALHDRDALGLWVIGRVVVQLELDGNEGIAEKRGFLAVGAKRGSEIGEHSGDGGSRRATRRLRQQSMLHAEAALKPRDELGPQSWIVRRPAHGIFDAVQERLSRVEWVFVGG